MPLDLENSLNEEQRQVVLAGDGPILVIAGAGSGKTRTLTYRVAHLVNSGVPVERILLCTFTNKAAREMVGRVEFLLERSIDHLWGGTFHSIANRFLRRHAERLGFGQNFTILDRDDSNHLIDSVIRDMGYGKNSTYRFPKGKALGGLFGLAHATGESVESIIFHSFEKFAGIADEIGEVMRGYDLRKQELNGMDFDDLLKYWYKLLSDFDDLHERYANYFQHILVDEYQDTNPLQAAIIDRLASAHGNLTVVGDDAQSIYRFRGADCRHILEFPHRYKKCQTFYLRNNYRSTPQILDVSNRVIGYNINQFPKKLEAMRDLGVTPEVVMAEDAIREAHWVAKKAAQLQREGRSLNDMAVLYRIHSHSLELQIALQQQGVPFVVRSGLRFFDQAHVKDVIAWLRVLFNPKDLLAWSRILPLFNGIGPATVKKIVRHLEEEEFDYQALDNKVWLKKISSKARKSVQWLVRMLEEALIPDNFKNPGTLIRIFFEQEYNDYLTNSFQDAVKRGEDIVEFAAFASSYKSLSRFLTDMMLQTDAIPSSEDEVPADDEAIVLSTVHQAKGLEWDTVFCLNLIEGSFPFFLALQEEGGPEEERRLFYVAATRAKDRLFLCSRQMTQSRGGLLRTADPSRFLWEILQDYEEYKKSPSGSLAQFLLKAEHQPLFHIQYV